MSASKPQKFFGLLGILAFLLLSYPLLQIFNRATLVVGAPLLALYIFGVWILAITGLYVTGSRIASRDLQG
jgi:hypothetical protein